jgi:hypothetical protein
MLTGFSHRRVIKKARFADRQFAAKGLLQSVFALTLTLTFGLFTPAAAQDNAPAISDAGTFSLQLTDRTFRDMTDLNALSDFSEPLIDLPVDAVGSTLFKLDLSNPTCLAGVESCVRRSDRLSLGMSEYITAKKDDGIDLVLRPRASFRFDQESSSALVGAVLEIGEDLREGADMKTNTWYLFAGADAEALTYSPESLRTLSSGNFHLQDRIIVGDAQAGLGYRIGDADVSLSYLRREATAEGYSYNEDAAALSFTWKR